MDTDPEFFDKVLSFLAEEEDEMNEIYLRDSSRSDLESTEMLNNSQVSTLFDVSHFYSEEIDELPENFELMSLANRPFAMSTPLPMPQNDLKCNFCLKNGEIPSVFTSHNLKDAKGNTTCPILRKLVCEMCGAKGDRAHTRKYCPLYVETRKPVQMPSYRRLANGVLTKVKNHK